MASVPVLRMLNPWELALSWVRRVGAEAVGVALPVVAEPLLLVNRLRPQPWDLDFRPFKISWLQVSGRDITHRLLE